MPVAAIGGGAMVFIGAPPPMHEETRVIPIWTSIVCEEPYDEPYEGMVARAPATKDVHASNLAIASVEFIHTKLIDWMKRWVRPFSALRRVGLRGMRKLFNWQRSTFDKCNYIEDLPEMLVERKEWGMEDRRLERSESTGQVLKRRVKREQKGGRGNV
jgi:hypothetical protein